MSNQREWSLSNFLGEVRELKERMEKVFPSYLASLEKTSQLPGEFTRIWWSSRVEVLLEKVRANYQQYHARAKEADLLGKFMTLGVDMVLKAGGMEPVPPPTSLQVGVSISPLGKIEPTLFDDPNKQPDTIVTTFEGFEAIAQRLRGEILKGTIVPKSEDEIPKLVYGIAAEQK